MSGHDWTIRSTNAPTSAGGSRFAMNRSIALPEASGRSRAGSCCGSRSGVMLRLASKVKVASVRQQRRTASACDNRAEQPTAVHFICAKIQPIAIIQCREQPDALEQTSICRAARQTKPPQKATQRAQRRRCTARPERGSPGAAGLRAIHRVLKTPATHRRELASHR